MHPPPLESNIAPPSLSGPKWPTPPQWQANIHLLYTNLISTEKKKNIYLFASAYSPGPLFNSHHSSPSFALESPFILCPCLPSTGGRCGGF